MGQCGALRSARGSLMMCASLRMAKKLEPRHQTHLSTASGELLSRARKGDERALNTLFRRQANALHKWARGRLPSWARALNDTADVVQDALMQTFRRLDHFENRGKGALQAFLRQAVVNRIHDEMRRVGRRVVVEFDLSVVDAPAHDPSPFEVTLNGEQEERALTDLSEEDRLLVVGRLELGYNYAQLAVVSARPTAEAARLATRRAVMKLAQGMSRAR
jgi:RNA polymerase sigma-70 factor (ECF subfamily)